MVSRPGKIQPTPPEEPNKIKIVVCGEVQVGKTAFCQVTTGADFNPKHEATIGSDYYMKTQKTLNGLF